MKNKILSILLAGVMLVSLSACGGGASSSAPTPAPSSSGSSVVAPEPSSSGSSVAAPAPSSSVAPVAPVGEVTIKDHLGREVKFEKTPERIVSGYYITSSLIIALGLDDKMVGIEEKAGSRPIYGLAAPELLKLDNVGSAKNFNLEACIAMKPDLVILPVKLKDAVKTLEDMKINVIAVNPENEQSLKEAITMIGTATNTMDKADMLMKAIDDKKKMLSDNVAKMTTKPKVYVAGNSAFLSTATAKMYQSTMVELAGGELVSKDIDDTYWATVSYEQLIAYNPDVIVIVPFASYKKDDILKDEKLKGLTAIKNGAVYEMPASFEAWDSPVPSSILGSMWLHAIINEGAYSFDTFSNEATTFYKEFYGIDIDKTLLTK